jgi:hypothetical protein
MATDRVLTVPPLGTDQSSRGVGTTVEDVRGEPLDEHHLSLVEQG